MWLFISDMGSGDKVMVMLGLCCDQSLYSAYGSFACRVASGFLGWFWVYSGVFFLRWVLEDDEILSEEERKVDERARKVRMKTEEWDLSAEELDSLERDAFRQIALRNSSSSTASVSNNSIYSSNLNPFNPSLPRKVDDFPPGSRILSPSIVVGELLPILLICFFFFFFLSP